MIHSRVIPLASFACALYCTIAFFVTGHWPFIVLEYGFLSMLFMPDHWYDPAIRQAR
jgi:hypothetical protein